MTHLRLCVLLGLVAMLVAGCDGDLGQLTDSGMFLCESSGDEAYIPKNRVCDGRRDCDDGQDERGPAFNGPCLVCDQEESETFHPNMRCNGTADCENGVDELGCESFDANMGDGQDMTSPDCIDADGDGFGTRDDCQEGPADCDDSNLDTNPGAPEICDGLDNDCDEQIDEVEDMFLSHLRCDAPFGTVCWDENHEPLRSCVDGQLVPANCDNDPNCPGPDCIFGPDYVRDEGVDNAGCGDNEDNDCDVVIDEGCETCDPGFDCGTGCPDGVSDEECACKQGPYGMCGPDGETLGCFLPDGTPVIYPFDQPEIPGNGIDDNCDGLVDQPALPRCGDGVIDEELGETCDRDTHIHTCESLGYSGGFLGCNYDGCYIMPDTCIL